MKTFNEFVIKNDISYLLEEVGKLDEFMGGIAGATQAATQGIGNSLGNMWNGVKSGIQNMGQNIANGYQQGQNKANIQRVFKNVNDLKSGLRTVGFTDPKVQGVLNNISNVLQTGLGQNMRVGNQNVKFNTAGQMPNFNSRIQQARNIYGQQKMTQAGGSGI